MVCTDEMQFSFVPGKDTTDATLLSDNFRKSTFPWKSLWSCAKKSSLVDFKEFGSRKIISSNYPRYANGRSRVCAIGQYSSEFQIGVGVYRVQSLTILFILVLEALSREIRTGLPWELFYVHD